MTKYIYTSENRNLTKEAIKGLKNANSIVFKTTSNRDRSLSNASFIQATVDANMDKGTMEHLYFIPCFSNYDSRIDTYDCCSCILSAQFHDEWKTVTSLLRADDRLYIDWGKGLYGNDRTEDLNLSGDCLKLKVLRYSNRTYTHEKKYVFLLNVEFTNKDNKMRMIRNKKEVVSVFD